MKQRVSPNRCSSTFQIDMLPEPRSTSAFEVYCSWSLSAKRPSPSSRCLDPPSSISRSIASGRSCQAQWAEIFAPHSPRLSGLHWPSILCLRVLWCIAVSPKSSRPSVSLHRDDSSSDRSRCCGCQPSLMRIAQLARLPESTATSRPGVVLFGP